MPEINQCVCGPAIKLTRRVVPRARGHHTPVSLGKFNRLNDARVGVAGCIHSFVTGEAALTGQYTTGHIRMRDTARVILYHRDRVVCHGMRLGEGHKH